MLPSREHSKQTLSHGDLERQDTPLLFLGNLPGGHSGRWSHPTVRPAGRLWPWRRPSGAASRRLKSAAPLPSAHAPAGLESRQMGRGGRPGLGGAWEQVSGLAICGSWRGVGFPGCPSCAESRLACAERGAGPSGRWGCGQWAGQPARRRDHFSRSSPEEGYLVLSVS